LAFDCAFQPDLDPKRLAELRSYRFVARNVGCLILGPPGTGKSHIAIAFGMEAPPVATSCATAPSTASSAASAKPTRSAEARDTPCVLPAPARPDLRRVSYRPLDRGDANRYFSSSTAATPAAR
jgi:hypothetical protein